MHDSSCLSSTTQKIQDLLETLDRLDSTNNELTYVIRSLLKLHLDRLDQFVASALIVLDNSDGLSRENVLSLLSLVLVFQHNH